MKPLRTPSDVVVEAAYRVVLSPAYGEAGCELLVFGSGKRGAFHLRGSHPRIDASDVRNIPLRRGDWPALVDHVEARRLWALDPLDLQRAFVTDGVFHLFEATGTAVHPVRIPFGSAPAARLTEALDCVIDACARAACREAQ